MSDPKDTIPLGYCHCGCGQKTKISNKTDSQKRIIQGQPKRYIAGHFRRIHGPVAKDCGFETNCLEFQGFIDRHGYGKVCFNGKTKLSHIAEWIKANGEIPKGMDIHHRCHNPRCVNVDHLELVSHRTHTAKLTVQDALEIRASVGVPQRKLAEKYGVSRRTIEYVLRNKRWKSISSEELALVRVVSE